MPMSIPLLACLVLAVQAPDSTEPVRARTTILHLEGGSVLRVKARERADSWEVLQDGEWRLLPPGLVLRAAPESEVLAQARKLESSIPRKDLVRRVAYADWLIAEGLHAEALQQLDRVLEAEPDQGDALSLLARAQIPLSLPDATAGPEELEDFFTAAARLSPSGREIAVSRLGEVREIRGLRERVAQELLARNAGRRVFATLVLRRILPGSEVQALLGRAILDPSGEVRTGAALALRDADEPAVILPALRSIGSRHALVRTRAIEALSDMEYREAVEPLYEHLLALQSGGGAAGAPRAYIFTGKQTAYVQDFDVEVAQGAAIADPQINVLTEGSVLDVAVIGVNEYQVASERAVVRRALSKLTGADPGDTTVAWQRWWQEHGDEWQAGATPHEAPTSPAGRGG